MQPGTIISGVAHTLLILFALFGGLFERDPLPPPDVAQVSVLSEEEFAALTRPEMGEQQAETEPPTAALEIPEPAPAPEPEPAREPTPEPDPAPAPEPTPPAPQPDPAPPAPEAPPAPPTPQVRDDRPVAPQDVPRPAPRVSTEATPPPPPEAEQAPEVVEAPAPEPEPEEPAEVVEDQTPTAPPETADQIVTEAERPSQLTNAAPLGTPRPRGRPERPAPAPQTETARDQPAPTEAPRTEADTQTAASDNVNSAVQDTLAGLEQLIEQAPQQGIPAGPPLTDGEKEAFRLSVRQCWIVDTGSEAANVTVSIRFGLNRDGSVQADTLRQTGASGGSDAAIRSAFDAGRRAILRCAAQQGGYKLPPEKYGQWQEVEVTFNPEGMRLR
ncbi:hypothetical protein SAMN04488012_103233 [Palleronia salina]|uniref:Cell division and transport-associated protein TolA n=1 Tax=Palleronia salina TaxID=313368 RepID=A0A1M6EVE2_9RHOB|nr:hypothetical protein [Palleronia salina]SHI89402.1 hypothetical protein SAMN04488012_103233 [Palleronia salina]